MTKIDIFSGFLGAGKTTLIKKLISDGYNGEKLVLIENEFGEIAVDGGFLKDAGIEITEMSSGCICCSLVGDFHDALGKVIDEFHPDRILIEPSGVGKLSDVIKAVQGVETEDVKLNGFTTVVDASKAKMYMKNFGEFFNNQIEHAACIILSRTGKLSEAKLSETLALIKEKNPEAVIITTPWEELSGSVILEAIERKTTLKETLAELISNMVIEDEDEDEHEHHHDHDDHDHDEDEDEHEHHDHDDHDEHDHEDHDEHEHSHAHHHHHHHHHGDGDHDADEIFESWGVESAHKYSEEDITAILTALDDSEKYGMVLRSKGIVPASDGGEWIHFDYTPGEVNVRRGTAEVTGRVCVIGSELKEPALKELFQIG